jgi:hypothetical protein
MTNTANGFVIDPFAREVRKWTFETGLDGIKKAIGLTDSPIAWVTLHRFPTGASLGLYLDDEGLLNNQEVQQFWHLPVEPPQLLAGKALLCYVNAEGDCDQIPERLYELLFVDLTQLRPVTWLGDAWAAEAAIKAGKIEQPTSAGNGEVFFRWQAPARAEGGAE